MSSFFLLLVGTLHLSLSVGGTTAGGVIYAAAPEERGAFHVGGKGVYNYGYNTGDGIAKVEVRHKDGSVTGSYRYFDPLGRQIVRSYIADSKGFRVLGNDLPVSPDTPAIGILNTQTLTGAVEGTQEFSLPNLVTQDGTAFVLQNRTPVQSSITSTKTLSNVNNQVAHYQQRFTEQQNEIVRKQQELIRQQEEKLAQLKLQQQKYIQEQQRQIDELKVLQQTQQQKQQQQQHIQLQQQQQFKLNKREQVQQTQQGYYSSFNNVFGLDSPYFYADDNINYDFPAGFAYNVAPSYMVNPVGVKGDHTSLLMTAGYTHSNRNQKPVYNAYYSNRKSPFENNRYRRPYIVGQAR